MTQTCQTCQYIFSRGARKNDKCGKTCEGEMCAVHAKCKMKPKPTAEEQEMRKEKLKDTRKRRNALKLAETLNVETERFLSAFKSKEGFDNYVKPLKKDKPSAEAFAVHPLKHVITNGSLADVQFVCDFLKAHKKAVK